MSNSTGPADRQLGRRSGAWLAAALASPLLIHFAAVYQHDGLALAALLCLALPAVWLAARRRRWRPALLALSALALAWWVLGGLSLLYALPVLINLGLGLLFASSLLPGRKPLICAFVEGQHDTVSAAQYRYARRVTLVWSLFFAVMALQTLLLARYAPAAIWSLFVNGINYGLVLALFALEYQVRKRALPQVRHDGFLRFLGSVARTDLRRLLQPAP